MALTSVAVAVGFSDELVSRCVDGDERAWQRLYVEQRGSVRAFLRRLGVRSETLEDATQDVFLEAFRHLPRFRRESSLRTWLFRLCVTQARRSRRRRQITQALSRMVPMMSPSDSSGQRMLATRAEMLVDGGLGTLTAGEREVFVLYELEGVSGREVSRLVGCSEPAVWRRLHYARRKFCQYVESQQGGSP